MIGTGRDYDLERRFLDAVERVAPIPAGSGFAASVTARLDEGDVTFGDAFLARSVAELLREALAEQVDGPAWGLLALTVASSSCLDERTLGRLRADLNAAAVASATAHAHLTRAHALLAADKGAGR
ncbi:MAG: hypothetical protein V9E83_06955 [Baekduia sp.]